jgi:hypothetical protein
MLEGSNDAFGVTAVAVNDLIALEGSNDVLEESDAVIALEGSNDAVAVTAVAVASIGFGRRVYFLLTTGRGERGVRSIDSTLSFMGSITSIVT